MVSHEDACTHAEVAWSFAVHHNTYQQLFLASFSMSNFATNTNHHLLHSLGHFITCVSPAELVSIEEVLDSPMNQKVSSIIENKQFQLLYDASTIPNRARLMSVSSNFAASWLSVVPSPGLNLHLNNATMMNARCRYNGG